MARTLVIGVDSFEIPDQGDNADYGEVLTDFFEAVAEALSSVQQPNDILRTTAVIANNRTIFSPIVGFAFDTTEVRSINTEFIIQRSTSEGKLVESGLMQGLFDGETWSFSIESMGNAEVEFEITDAGQVQYKSSLMTGNTYSGFIIFRAKVFNE
jgi:hypothetical protein